MTTLDSHFRIAELENGLLQQWVVSWWRSINNFEDHSMIDVGFTLVSNTGYGVVHTFTWGCKDLAGPLVLKRASRFLISLNLADCQILFG